MSVAAADYNMQVLQKQYQQVTHHKKMVQRRNISETHFGDGHGSSMALGHDTAHDLEDVAGRHHGEFGVHLRHDPRRNASTDHFSQGGMMTTGKDEIHQYVKPSNKHSEDHFANGGMTTTGEGELSMDGHGRRHTDSISDPHQDVDHIGRSMVPDVDYGAEVLDHLGHATRATAAHTQQDHFAHTMVANADYATEVLDHLGPSTKESAYFKQQDHMNVACQPTDYNDLVGAGRSTAESAARTQKSSLTVGGQVMRHSTEQRPDRLQKGGLKAHANQASAHGDHMWGVMTDASEDVSHKPNAAKDAHNAPTSHESLYDANGNLVERTDCGRLRDAEQANYKFRDHFGAGLLEPDAGGAGAEHQIWNSCGATRPAAHFGGAQSKYNQQSHFSFS